MITHKYIDEYISLWKAGKIVLNKDRIDLINWVQNVVLIQDNIHFDDEHINNFIAFTEKYFFKLKLFQKFLIPFIFLYNNDGSLVFDEFFYTMARGSGKNGLISALCAYFISPLHGIPKYNTAIVANSEKQSKTSFTEIYEMLEIHPELTDKETGHFKNGLAKIRCTTTQSEIEYLTSNAETKDSFRHGCIIFDEIHQFESDDIISVLTSGLGKVENARVFYISTTGFVREGVYDTKIRRCREILAMKELRFAIFPWICTMDEPAEINDVNLWQKSNPMFHPPLCKYSKILMAKVKREYEEVRLGLEDKAKFNTKRMNLTDVQLESSVAPRSEILATNQPFPDLTGMACIGAIDYASLRDFCSVGCLFHRDDKYYWITHSWIRQGFLDNVGLAIADEIPEWERHGLLTVVNTPVISMREPVRWFNEMSEKYNVLMIIGDTYRMDIVRPALEEAGYELDFIRRSKSIQAGIAPTIETLFANKKLVYGDNPLMRWFTNNVYVARDGYGNMTYEKKEEKRRKTDGFMCFTHAFWKKDLLIEAEGSDFMLEDFYV